MSPHEMKITPTEWSPLLYLAFFLSFVAGNGFLRARLGVSVVYTGTCGESTTGVGVERSFLQAVLEKVICEWVSYID